MVGLNLTFTLLVLRLRALYTHAAKTSVSTLQSAEKLRIFRRRYIVGTLTNKANIIIEYYLVPCCLSTDPKIRDLEWLWMACMAILRYMFTTTNCHWLIICYLFAVVCLLHVCSTNTWPAEKCGKRSIANSDPRSGRIFGIRGKSADLPWTLYRRNLNK